MICIARFNLKFHLLYTAYFLLAKAAISGRRNERFILLKVVSTILPKIELKVRSILCVMTTATHNEGRKIC